MESLFKKSSNEGAITRSNELLRLRRANNEINRLSTKLKSYKCEPCTYSLHQKFQSLKERMESLKNGNDEIISSVEQGKQYIEDISDRVVQQLRDFNELRMGVFDYTKMVKSH